MKKLNFNLLQGSLDRLGISKQIDAMDVLDIFKGWIKNNFGGSAAKEVEPVWVKQGSLGVRVNNGPLREQIKNREKDILWFINKRKPNSGVRRIRFIL